MSKSGALSDILGQAFRPLRRGLVLKEHPFGELSEVDEATAAELVKYQPFVGVHRGGNDLARIGVSAATDGYVETDLRMWRGELIVAHERRIGPVEYDPTRSLIRLAGAPLKLSTVLGEVERLNARLLLDFKIGAEWAPAVIGSLRKHRLLTTTAFTGLWSPLDAIAASGVETAGLYYGSIDRDWKLDRFLDEQARHQRSEASLHVKLATEENIRRLHKSKVRVVVYVISEGQQALQLLRRGADGIITNNLSLAKVWKVPREEANRASDQLAP
jgi:hypothetical protein